MVTQTKWVERTFAFNNPVGLFPCILERFRGTPARLEDITRGLTRPILTTQIDGRWSIQEHAGHLWDLEELGERRLAEFLAEATRLGAADMENKKTFAASHNEKTIDEVLKGLRNARERLVHKLERLDEKQVGMASLHPRLNTPMKLVDWVYFMTEHDDHHLARITGLWRSLMERGGQVKVRK